MPVVKSAATSLPVTVYNLVQGKFEGIPCPTGRPQEEENPSAHSCNLSQQRQQPEAAPTVTNPQTREDTRGPNIMPVSTNLFEARASWPIPPSETPTVVKVEKTEVPPRVAAIPHALVLNKPQNNRPVKEKCTGGLHCPICTKKKMVQMTGMMTDRRTSRGPITPKTLNIPKPMTFLIGFPNRSN